MILSAHQPAYLPWLGYFHKIAVSDIFVILDEVQFEKNSFTNRNKIKTSNGSTWISVPMQMNGHTNKTINEMEIDNKYNWKEKHWKSIYLNYKKSSYFNLYSDFLEDTYKKEWNSLTKLTEYMTTYFLDEIGIKTKLYRQSHICTKNKKQELIIELCQKFDCHTFIFGKMGENYADIEYFKQNGVNAYFQHYNHPIYNQIWHEFIPSLAIIDLLFNVNKDNVLEIIMKENITKEDVRKMFL
ncbi:TPA: WbqC family protein [Clostridium botulinum]|nr:WbqC family protein [Clostridium botulinum]